MYTLMVSYDYGMCYYPDRSAATVAELRPRMDELDTLWLRWYIENDTGEDVEEICAIHAGILDFIAAAREPDDSRNKEKQ